MTRRRSSKRWLGALAAAAVCSPLVSGCGTPPPDGFVGVGCYDHRDRLVPTVHTPGECAASTWTWRTEAWKPAAPKP